jgi:hypothetical protein
MTGLCAIREEDSSCMTLVTVVTVAVYQCSLK